MFLLPQRSDLHTTTGSGSDVVTTGSIGSGVGLVTWYVLSPQTCGATFGVGVGDGVSEITSSWGVFFKATLPTIRVVIRTAVPIIVAAVAF